MDIERECCLCGKEAVDQREFEVGNNAEWAVSADLCEAHMKECDDLGYGFEQKYFERLCQVYVERYF